MRDESSLPTVLRKNLPPNLEKIKVGKYSESDWDYPVHEYLKENDIRVDETGSDVIEFLRGKSVLLTGGTGFLGKLMVEKLLRCCEDIDKIYLIVRTKKGQDAETRIKEYLDNWVFVKLSEIRPNFREKVIGISGDIEQDGIGLSAESRQILTQKVNIIYHVAATVRFDEKLKKAVKINMIGTQEIIKLAKECIKLDVLTYISTAYSNCTHKEIKEDFYAATIDPQVLIDVTEKLSSDMIDKLTPGLLGDFPNTYTFTKHLAEDIIRTETIGMTTCIQRPSIVIASVREPIRSWVGNIFGPVGLVLAGAMGLIHVMHGNPNGRCDVVPVDYVINNCIAASYKTAKQRQTDKVEIFNFTTSSENPFYWKNLGIASDPGFKVGSQKVLINPFVRFVKCWYWFMFLKFALHTVPGYILDFVAVRLGKKPQLTNAYTRLDNFIHLLHYFTMNEWSFQTTNTTNLWNSLNEKDKRIFAFDMSALNWTDNFTTYMVTMREFLLLDHLDSLESGRTHLRRVTITFSIVVGALLLLSTYYLINTIFCFIPLVIISITLYFKLTDYK